MADTNQDPEEMMVMAIKKNDPDMVAGRVEAQRTIDVFLCIHNEHKDNIGVYFAIKAGVPDDGCTTFLWYTFTEEKEGKLLAYHHNIPEDLKQYEKIAVGKEEIQDWMINDHGYLIGGWSVRVQRSKIPNAERAAFDESAGIRVYRENDF
ncbi:MAG: DUF2314 domain-containing protein [Verrucomicrobiota bacterium]